MSEPAYSGGLLKFAVVLKSAQGRAFIPRGALKVPFNTNEQYRLLLRPNNASKIMTQPGIKDQMGQIHNQGFSMDPQYRAKILEMLKNNPNALSQFRGMGANIAPGTGTNPFPKGGPFTP